MGRFLFPALCALASAVAAQEATSPVTEPVTLDEVPRFYEGRAAAGKPPRKPMLTFGAPMKVGHVGTIPEGPYAGEKNPFYQVRIMQVLEKNRILVEVATYRWVLKIVGEGAFARPAGERPEESRRDTIIVEGIDTTDAVDDKPIALAGDWRVARTEAYETVAGGSRTVFVIVPIDLPKPAEARKRAAPEPKVEAEDLPASNPKPMLRTWRDVTGKFSIDAEFRGVTGDEVRLRTEDGRSIRVPLAKLSDEDRQWIGDRSR